MPILPMKLRLDTAKPQTIGALLLGASLLLVPSLQAQMTTPSIAPQFPRPDAPGGRDDDAFRNNPGLRERLERGRAAERQRRIVDDANRLVELTVQYQKALDTRGGATADDQKLLVQIEKLAREVKDRMRGM